MKESKILVVDDNKSVLSALELLLKGRCQFLKCISSPNLLITELQSRPYDVLLLDMNFKAGINTGNEGIYWLQRVLEVDQAISVVMITAYGDVELAVKAVRMGAADFVLKPWENEKMLVTIESAFRLSKSKAEVKKLQIKESQLIAEINRTDKNLIGSSPEWMEIIELVKKVAITDANVLITGENGTGKEMIAREIHRLSQRSKKVMVTVDMGSITESLFESELFGHKKGAFTDAHSNRTGKIETASEGTLFLDEIGNLPMAMQAKLLNVLQSRKVTRVGENIPFDVDIRLISATNCDLIKRVGEGTFREDLLYRINTIQIELPPLRARKTDIPVLADFFLQKYSFKYHKEGIKISDEAVKKMINYHWPGNVRELQHAIEKAIILCDEKILGPSEFLFKNEPNTNPIFAESTLEDMEKKLINAALKKQGGNLTAVAGQLGITRQTLYNKIKRYGLQAL
ncbi:MAG: sigma-54-dependent Fis family transcriptional regulator [Prolixibacteraceae bacterium]|nr:sigma-54-dependent Fis family transcriptional regulator [Prolixibacteraceae bacterium]